MKIKNFNFNPEQITSGILHFGVGNFHRAHLQSYTNQLLNEPSQRNWGICGAMLMPSDEKLFRTLKSQQGNYSLTVCGRDDSNHVEWIGSLVELLWAGENSAQIIAKIADPNIKIITMTITEGGYNLSTETVKYDLENPKTPKSVFGFVAEGLRARRDSGVGAITILSCDNLQHNGDTCARIFKDFFEMQDPDLATWVRENVSFPNSMVDRITPATTPQDIERINKELDKQDLAPVYCEDYLQWVVEDKFMAGRPSWEKVGVEFTDDVAPFENMKLSLLNASHTLLSYPSVLMGYRKVDAAMRDELIIKFVRDFMDKDTTPYVPAPKNTDLDVYKQTLIERFANKTVSDQLSRLCGDGASKFPVYVVPIINKMLSNGDDMTRIAFLIACYYKYLKFHTDDNGEFFDIFEPQLLATDYQILEDDNPAKFLSSSPFAMTDLASNEDFKSLYIKMLDDLSTLGVKKTLETIL